MKKQFQKEDEARKFAAEQLKESNSVVFQKEADGWSVSSEKGKPDATPEQLKKFKSEENVARGLAEILILKDKHEYVKFDYNHEFKENESLNMWIVVSQVKKG
jgi:hypothetical protein